MTSSPSSSPAPAARRRPRSRRSAARCRRPRPQALPPVDPEADRLIGDMFNRYPAARYRMTQLAFVQEHALAEAQNRIQRLEWELQQAQQAAQQAQEQQRNGGAGGGFFSGLFGGGSRSAPPPQGGPGPAWNQRGPQPGYQQGGPQQGYSAGRAAAAICAELPAGHVPALRLRVPGLGADHRGGRGGRSGRRQCADEPVLRFAQFRRRRVRRGSGGRRSVGRCAGGPGLCGPGHLD